MGEGTPSEELLARRRLKAGGRLTHFLLKEAQVVVPLGWLGQGLLTDVVAKVMFVVVVTFMKSGQCIFLSYSNIQFVTTNCCCKGF